MYEAARNTRLTAGWYAANNSADSELATSLRLLRARARALVRDAPYAKRAKNVVVNNVIGSGIGMQSAIENNRGRRIELNAAIEAAFCEWSLPENCHTGGKLHFADIERVIFGEIFEAGEIIVRMHRRAFGSSGIPLALEIVEPERIADDYSAAPGALAGLLKMGIEVDEFQRPIAAWIREYHPNEIRVQLSRDKLQRVLFDDLFHLHLVDRWPQTRGEPWLHATAARLNDMAGYSEAEIVAARGAAAYMGVIESPEPQALPPVSTENPQSQLEIEPGLMQHLLPGEKLNFISPNRPNPNMDPFMRMMLREACAGIGPTSYESVSRDYSQSNYSSSRLALIDDRDAYRALQCWFIRAFRAPLHRMWLQTAVMAGAIPGLDAATYGASPEKFSAVQFKPRGWSWVDPTKEVDAYIRAVRAGFMTVGDVIALTGNGRDRDDVWNERKHELDIADDLELEFDTSPSVDATGRPVSEPAAPVAPPTPLPGGTPSDGEEPPARVVNLRSANA